MVGIVYVLVRLNAKAGAAAWRHSEGRPMLRTAYMGAGTALLALLVFIWLPNGDYRPLRPGERWTLASGLQSFRYLGTGRPGLTPADPRAQNHPFSANPNDVPAPAPAAGPATTTGGPTPAPTPAPTADGSFGSTPTPFPDATPTPVVTSPTPGTTTAP
jgi:hypothetical protein